MPFRCHCFLLVPLTLSSPAEVAGFEPKRAVLHVATPAPYRVYACVAQFGHRGGTSHLELPLLPVLGPLPAGLAALVPRVPRYTWDGAREAIWLSKANMPVIL